jgi:hypothetical protein
MKICQFDDRRIGVVHGAEVTDLTAAIPAGERQAAIWLAALPPAERERLCSLAPRARLAELRLASPLSAPGKVVAARSTTRPMSRRCSPTARPMAIC